MEWLGIPWSVTLLFILCSTRTIRFRRLGAIPRDNSAAFHAKSPVFAVLTVNITSFCFIPTLIGPTATGPKSRDLLTYLINAVTMWNYAPAQGVCGL